MIKGEKKRKTQADRAKPASCEDCSRWKEIRKRLRVEQLLAALIKKMETRLKSEEIKPSVTDYIKLVEMEEELSQNSESVKEIKVTWVDQRESETAQ